MPQSAPLNSFRIRPRFEQFVAASPETVHAALLRDLTAHAPTLVVRSFPAFIGMHVPDAERRAWSPRLFLSIDAAPGGGTRIEGIYGPEIEVWSVFLYGYIATGMLGTFSGIYGGAQFWLGDPPWALYVTGSMAIIAGLLYLGAQLGQKLGAHQTFQLHQAYTAAASKLTKQV